MHDLVADGNSVLLVDHDTEILAEADWLIEMGPKSGADGGEVIAQGTIAEIKNNRISQIGAFLSRRGERIRPPVRGSDVFENGEIVLATGAVHTVKPLEVRIPKGRLTVVTGVSGSGKTTLILESLVPALKAQLCADKLLKLRLIIHRTWVTSDCFCGACVQRVSEQE